MILFRKNIIYIKKKKKMRKKMLFPCLDNFNYELSEITP